MTIEEQTTQITEPSWLRKVNTCAPEYSLSFKEMDGVYRYFRSTLVLYNKSERSENFHDVGQQLTKLFETNSFPTLLVIKEIIHSLTKLGVGPEQPLAVRKKRFHVKKRAHYETPKLKRLNQMLTIGAQNTRRNEWSYRLITAMNENIKKGWFPVIRDLYRRPSNASGRMRDS